MDIFEFLSIAFQNSRTRFKEARSCCWETDEKINFDHMLK